MADRVLKNEKIEVLWNSHDAAENLEIQISGMDRIEIPETVDRGCTEF